MVSNVAGVVTSSNASLTVILPPALVQVASGGGPAGGTVTVPVNLVANGNENALGFSLHFDPAMLTYAGAVLGTGASGAAFFLNTNQAASGNVGIALALPAEATFPVGTQELVQVSFTLAIVTNAASATIGFGDVPIGRQISDAPGQALAGTYAGGTIAIAAVEFEADTSPRPNGDRDVTITDWVLIGRYAARLDYPSNGLEFARADCAPRASLGDGAITVVDWVQAGRYAARLDPLTPVGGPTSEVVTVSLPLKPEPKDPSRVLRVVDGLVLQHQTNAVSVTLSALGNENALGFSLAFDPAVMTYASASLGGGATGATLNVNSAQAASGHLGFTLALGPGGTFSAGSKELAVVRFRAATPNSTTGTVSLTSQPVPLQVSDPYASVLQATYADGRVAINPSPFLSVARSPGGIVISWPQWGSNFALQTAQGPWSPAISWSNLTAPVALTNGSITVSVPPGSDTRFYRLWLP
jgi:hypothetical protein